MNENHRKLCSSLEWADYLRDEVLPALDDLVEWGGELLELGPGPGAATAWLCRRVKRVVALEVDAGAADRLAQRYPGSNVDVAVGDGTSLCYSDASFDSVATFTMLHHVPTLTLQNKLLTEAFRVLKPGGVLVGSDSLASNGLHDFHADDTYNPIDPVILLALLRGIGFGRITLIIDDVLKFVARKPGELCETTGDSSECTRSNGKDGRPK